MAGKNKSDVKESTDSSTTLEDDDKGEILHSFWSPKRVISFRLELSLRCYFEVI